MKCIGHGVGTMASFDDSVKIVPKNSIIRWGMKRANEMDDVERKACLVGGPTASLSENASNGTTTITTKGVPMEQLGEGQQAAASTVVTVGVTKEAPSKEEGEGQEAASSNSVDAMGTSKEVASKEQGEGQEAATSNSVTAGATNEVPVKEKYQVRVPGWFIRTIAKGSPNYREMYLRWSRNADYEYGPYWDGTED